MKRSLVAVVRFLAIAAGCALFGAGVGLVQGGIVARGGDKVYQAAFGEGAAMIGALIAFFLGPTLLYALNRRIRFQRFCYIGVATLLVGCLAGWIFSMRPNAPGWASMFVTPIAAVVFAILLARESEDEKDDAHQVR